MFAARFTEDPDVTVVGEPMGGSPSLWGNARPVTLGDTGLVMDVSTLFEVGSDPDDPRLTIEPDIPVELTAADVADGPRPGHGDRAGRRPVTHDDDVRRPMTSDDRPAWSTYSLLFDVFVLDQAVGRLLGAAMAGGPLTPAEYAAYSVVFDEEAVTPDGDGTAPGDAAHDGHRPRPIDGAPGPPAARAEPGGRPLILRGADG